MKTHTLTVLSALGLVTCGRSSLDLPGPTFVSYEIVEGRASCAGCPLTGSRIEPGPDGVLVLRRDTTYTARSLVRTAGRPDRCVPGVFAYSWGLPNRNFSCTPEQVEMTIDDVIGTSHFDVDRAPNHRIVASLSEYEIDSRTRLSSQRLYEFPVRFVP
jgi:hypothetical protein